MRKLIRFWQKDFINKLIVLVGLVIVAVLALLIYFLSALPGGRSLAASFFPTPTLSLDEVFLLGGQTATAEALLTETAVIPTITTMPFTPLALTPTPSETADPAAMTPSPTEPPATALAQTEAPSASATPRPVAAGGNCPPLSNEQSGKVLEIVDGSTIRVLINDLVYVVRYIGVEPPQDANFADMSRFVNGELVYAQEVKLYPEGSGAADVDDNNRLLRYVVVKDSLLANREMIRLGWATAGTTAYTCAEDFLLVEGDARARKSGIWEMNSP